METVCSPQFKLKVPTNNFTWIHGADKESFKTRPKQSLAYRFQSAVRLCVVVVVSDVKVTSTIA